MFQIKLTTSKPLYCDNAIYSQLHSSQSRSSGRLSGLYRPYDGFLGCIWYNFLSSGWQNVLLLLRQAALKASVLPAVTCTTDVALSQFPALQDCPNSFINRITGCWTCQASSGFVQSCRKVQEHQGWLGMQLRDPIYSVTGSHDLRCNSASTVDS